MPSMSSTSAGVEEFGVDVGHQVFCRVLCGTVTGGREKGSNIFFKILKKILPSSLPPVNSCTSALTQLTRCADRSWLPLQQSSSLRWHPAPGRPPRPRARASWGSRRSSAARRARSTRSPTSPASRSATRRSSPASGRLVVGQGPGAHRRHRRPSARQGERRPRVRRLVHAQRQRRDDGHHVAAGERHPRRARSRSPTRTASASCATRSCSGRSSRPGLQPWGLPVVAETYDGGLNDINGFHVKAEHALRGARRRARRARWPRATSAAAPGWCATASRAASAPRRACSRAADGGYTVGVLVQCNYGARRELPRRRRAGGRGDPRPASVHRAPGCAARRPGIAAAARDAGRRAPSADARPGLDHRRGGDGRAAAAAPAQAHRDARRRSASGAWAGCGENSSGDIFVAFSTANPGCGRQPDERARRACSPTTRINPLFDATVQATEEAILNALLAAETMTGADGLRVHALPLDRLLAAMRKYGRLK